MEYNIFEMILNNELTHAKEYSEEIRDIFYNEKNGNSWNFKAIEELVSQIVWEWDDLLFAIRVEMGMINEPEIEEEEVE